MTLKAKTILKDKYWIVEDGESKVATLSFSDEKYMLSDANGISFYDNERQLKKALGNFIFEAQAEIRIPNTDENKIVSNFPTSCIPYNSMFDVKRKLPLFTKSVKSKSLYCAGYYIIHFDKGWVKSFCPKLITIERYEFKGPFKTELEMKQELSRANRSS
jgi:hypothetical protein